MRQPQRLSPEAARANESAVGGANVVSSDVPSRDYAYYKRAFAGRRMPFAYLDLDLLDANIRQVVARAGDKRIRVASKSVRCVTALKRILSSDDRFIGVMCLTGREAIYLAQQGITDVLIGYPCVAEAEIADVARATREGAQITLMVDDLAQIDRIESVAREVGTQLPLCLDVDLSLDVPGLHFGVWRSPVRSAAQARPLVERILGSPHVTLAGVMGYEAQIAGVGDNYPGQRVKNGIVWALKRRSVGIAAERRAAVVELIRSLGDELRFVNGGGSGSMGTTRAEAVVTELTVGSAFYGPALFDNYREFRYQPAAGFAVEIVRRPAPRVYTCLGGGYVASGAPGADRLPQPYLPPGARLDSLEGAGETQTPVHYAGDVPLAPGDPIFFRHSKAGELCERFTHLALVSQGAIVGEAPTYRGDGQCFL
ncbi:MAG TPA: amino acid deaminase/aldolase [Ktedonobacterales bacterium]|jgi:D-serine deaminase-like pyridoxal phosphate-dependent protein|nr:amino acid deaminase/aldolase [Ktedonobacterales bacterium]